MVPSSPYTLMLLNLPYAPLSMSAVSAVPHSNINAIDLQATAGVPLKDPVPDVVLVAPSSVPEFVTS